MSRTLVYDALLDHHRLNAPLRKVMLRRLGPKVTASLDTPLQLIARLARRARPFVVDDKATRIAAAISMADPEQMWQILQSLRLPHDPMWLDFPFRSYTRAVQEFGAELFDPTDSIDIDGMGMLLRTNGLGQIEVDMVVHLPPSRTGYPAVTHEPVGLIVDPVRPLPAARLPGAFDDLARKSGYLPEMVPYGYKGLFSPGHVAHRMARHLTFVMRPDVVIINQRLFGAVFPEDRPEDRLAVEMFNRAGVGRKVLALMALLLHPKIAALYDGDERTVRWGPNRQPYRYRPKVVTIHAAQEAYLHDPRQLRQGLASAIRAWHRVRGHWCYRRKNFNTTCLHEWVGDESQTCPKCGAQRWWRRPHERGDARLGVAGQVYRVTA